MFFFETNVTVPNTETHRSGICVAVSKCDAKPMPELIDDESAARGTSYWKAFRQEMKMSVCCAY